MFKIIPFIFLSLSLYAVQAAPVGRTSHLALARRRDPRDPPFGDFVGQNQFNDEIDDARERDAQRKQAEENKAKKPATDKGTTDTQETVRPKRSTLSRRQFGEPFVIPEDDRDQRFEDVPPDATEEDRRPQVLPEDEEERINRLNELFSRPRGGNRQQESDGEFFRRELSRRQRDDRDPPFGDFVGQNQFHDEIDDARERDAQRKKEEENRASRPATDNDNETIDTQDREFFRRKLSRRQFGDPFVIPEDDRDQRFEDVPPDATEEDRRPQVLPEDEEERTNRLNELFSRPRGGNRQQESDGEFF